MDTAVLTVLTNAGAFGVIIVLIILGFLVPKGAHQSLKDDRDEWRSIALKAQAALEQCHQTVAVADERALVSQEMARTATHLLTSLKTGTDTPTTREVQP